MTTTDLTATELTTTNLTATATVQDQDAARAVWLRIGALISAGLPVPHAVDITHDAQIAHVTLSCADDVAAWARALGAPEPDVHSHLHSKNPGRRLTTTSTALTVEGGTWLRVYHLAVEDIATPAVADAAAADAGSGSGVRS